MTRQAVNASHEAQPSCPALTILFASTLKERLILEL